MIRVTKEEAAYLRSTFPGIFIPSTCRTKPKGKRKTRYANESPKVLAALRNYRNSQKIIYNYPSNSKIGKVVVE